MIDWNWVLTSFLPVLGIFIVLLGPCIYFTWQERNHGKYEIKPEHGSYALYYNHHGEWMFDSNHETHQLAVDKIHFYLHRKAEFDIRTGNKS